LLTPVMLVSRSIRVGARPSWNQLLGFQKISLLKARLDKSELIQNINEHPRVSWRGSHQNIKIACVTRPSVQGETVCTDDDVINAAGVE
jgi:hypothetical protein